MEKRILISYAVAQELVELKWEGVECFYLKTGIGKVKSAFYLTHAIAGFQPDMVISIGTAGSIQHQVGDVFYCTQFIDRDLEKVKNLGISARVDSSLGLLEHAYTQSWQNEGTCNTGDSFVTTEADLVGDVIDMEAFAQAWVCEQLDVPFVAIKYVTDIIGQNSVKQWEDKLADAREGLAHYINEVIQGLE